LSPVHHKKAPGVPVEEFVVAQHDWVASESGSCPPQQLRAELGPLSEGRFDCGIIGVLESNEPALLECLAGQEIVIIRAKSVAAELTEEEFFGAEVGEEICMLQEASSVNGSSTGHDKDATVDRVGSPELPIVTLEITTGDEIDNG